MPCASGSQVRMVIDDLATPVFADSAPAARAKGTRKYEILSTTLAGSKEHIDVAGLTGTRERRAQALVDGVESIAGDVVMYMTPGDIDNLMLLIIGDNSSTTTEVTTFNFAELLPEFGILLDRVASNGTRATWEYQGLKVARAVIAGSAGSPVTLTMTLMGKTEVFHGAVFPASTVTLPVGATAQPYVFHESSVTYDGIAYQYNDFELIIDNFAEARQENSATAEEICATDLGVFLNLNVPWIDTFAADFNVADVTGNIAFTKSPYATTFTFGELVQTKAAPPVSGKGQIRWNLQLEARLAADGVLPAIRVVNDLAV